MKLTTICLFTLLLNFSLLAGTIGTVYRPIAGRVIYTASTLPRTSARSSSVFCSNCRRNTSCTAGTLETRDVGAMAFTVNGRGDWDCSTGVSSHVPDSFIQAIRGGVCIGIAGDISNCVPGQRVRLQGVESLSYGEFWEFWGRSVVNAKINEMRRFVCSEDLPSCESADRADLDDRDAADRSLRDRDLPSK